MCAVPTGTPGTNALLYTLDSLVCLVPWTPCYSSLPSIPTFLVTLVPFVLLVFIDPQVHLAPLDSLVSLNFLVNLISLGILHTKCWIVAPIILFQIFILANHNTLLSSLSPLAPDPHQILYPGLPGTLDPFTY